MHDDRYAHRLPRAAGQRGANGAGRRRQRIAENVRETDAAALEYRAVFQYATDAAAPFAALPFVAAKTTAVDLLECSD